MRPTRNMIIPMATAMARIIASAAPENSKTGIEHSSCLVMQRRNKQVNKYADFNNHL